MRYEVTSDLGEYYNQCHGMVITLAAEFVMSIIPDYNQMSASMATSQYGFKQGLKIFKEDEYKATVGEL